MPGKKELGLKSSGLIILFIFIISATSLNFAFDRFHRHRFQRLSKQAQLAGILHKAGAYCDKLKQIALHFVCCEEVREVIYSGPWPPRGGKPWKRQGKKFTYDYQLIRKDKIEESRILIKENGKSLHVQGASLKVGRFSYKFVILGPIGLMSFDSQKNHAYILEKSEKLWGRQVCVIEATPKSPEKDDHLFGKVWVDKANGSILKIVWTGSSLDNYAGVEEFAKKMKVKPNLILVSEYKYEKNGIRFPSKYELRENYIKKYIYGFRTFLKSELKVKYKDYKFFIVETQVEY